MKRSLKWLVGGCLILLTRSQVMAWTSDEAPSLRNAVLMDSSWSGWGSAAVTDRPVQSSPTPALAWPEPFLDEQPAPSSTPTPSPAPRPVISAAQAPLAPEETAASITVITRPEIEASGARTLGEVVRCVPGLEVLAYGGPGQLTYAMIRGAASERTQVLVNGLPVADPISPARATDLALVPLDNVERIEIVRGPQSVLFGSGAMGGVINLVTRGPEAVWEGRVGAEGGSYATSLGRFRVSGPWGPVGLAVGGSWLVTSGFSAAADTTVAEPEADGLRQQNLDATLSWRAADTLTLVLDSRLERLDLELDAYGGDGGDDPNYTSAATQAAGRLSARWDTAPGWRQTWSAGWLRRDRGTRNEPDPAHPNDAEESSWRGENLTADWKNQWSLGEWHTVSVGADYRQEFGQSRNRLEYWFFGPVVDLSVFDGHSSHVFGWFAEEAFRWEGLTAVAGMRYDAHDLYGGVWTWRVTPAWRVGHTGLRVKGSAGTAFNAPSLYQRYSVYGNETLRAEHALGWEAGLEQSIGPAIHAGATYFHTDYRDQIAFYTDPVTYAGSYINLDRVRTRGWEVSARTDPDGPVAIRLGYTRLWADDLTRGDDHPAPLLRRADYSAFAAVTLRWLGAMLDLEVRHTGPRLDADFDPVTYLPRTVTLDPYTLVNLTAEYAPWPDLHVRVRLHNLLNVAYQDVLGYTTSRFAAYAGVAWEWR